MSATLADRFTSTGHKLWWHQDVVRDLRAGKPSPVALHLLPTDTCQHTCAMCSVLTRVGESLLFKQIQGVLDQLCPLGLKAVVLSGGGNPLLYKCKESGMGFNELVDEIHGRGLELGLICNGLKMKQYECGRTSWVTCSPASLDKFTWIRISMAGLDHEERKVEVPDVDRTKTDLSFSYILHDIFHSPTEPNHGKVSTKEDFMRYEGSETAPNVEWADDRLPWLEEQFRHYYEKYQPTMMRFTPNCLEPNLIPKRVAQLQAIADRIDPTKLFAQNKPPSQPRACYKGYTQPVVNSDGWVFSCTSTVLNSAANHRFAEQWRVCRWDELADLYAKPIRHLVPNTICPGCVFNTQCEVIADVVEGVGEIPTLPEVEPEHANFI